MTYIPTSVADHEYAVAKKNLPGHLAEAWARVEESYEFFDGENEIALAHLNKFVAERKAAEDHAAEKEASFARSDTDGFLSQWASGLNAERARMRADLMENGGTHEFLALFDLDGNYVTARPVDGRFGTSWYIPGAPKGARYVPYFPVRRSTLAKRGYTEGYVVRPAMVEFTGSGRGLSGAASVRTVIAPADRPYDAPLSIVTADRWADR